MGIALKTAHLKRYKDIAYLLMKYGQVDLSKQPDLVEILWEGGVHNGDGNGETGNGAHRQTAAGSPQTSRTAVTAKEEELAEDLKRFGPTFVKLGQYLAKRPDLVPLRYIETLTNLATQISILTVPEVQQIIETELGTPVSEAFEKLEEPPLSTSTIEQVHAAVTLGGKRVIVKVQRPAVQEQIYADLQALDELLQFYDEHLKSGIQLDLRSMFDEFRNIMLAELDYRQEAHNLKAVKENLKELDLIVVPTPVWRLSTSKMLTIDFINGRKLTQVFHDGLLRSERSKLASQIVYAYLRQMLVDGFVDADPDPNSVLLTNDGKVALLDLGIVSRLSPAMQTKLLQLLLCISEGRAEQTAALIVEFGQKRSNFDESGFRRAVAALVMHHQDMLLERLEIGKIFQGIAQASFKYGLSLPSELAMLGTALVHLDHVAERLDAKFDCNRCIYQNASEIMKHHMRDAFSPAHVFHTILETTEFLEQLPGKVGKILDSLANNDLKFTVHAIDENVLIGGFQKIANRITIGLVLAALIMGAAMLMNIRTNFTIWGYPGLAILCFLIAGGCGFGLVVEILVSDHRSQ